MAEFLIVNKIISDILEIKITIRFLNNQCNEEVISMQLVMYKEEALRKNNIDITKKDMETYLSQSFIYLRESTSQSYEITSMILPWLLKDYSKRESRQIVRTMFYKILLQLINYYYYIKSAESFSIVKNTILPDKSDIKRFKKIFFDYDDDSKDKSKQVFQHIFINIKSLSQFQLNNQVFSEFENKSDEQYRSLKMLNKDVSLKDKSKRNSSVSKKTKQLSSSSRISNEKPPIEKKVKHPNSTKKVNESQILIQEQIQHQEDIEHQVVDVENNNLDKVKKKITTIEVEESKILDYCYENTDYERSLFLKLYQSCFKDILSTKFVEIKNSSNQFYAANIDDIVLSISLKQHILLCDNSSPIDVKILDFLILALNKHNKTKPLKSFALDSKCINKYRENRNTIRESLNQFSITDQEFTLNFILKYENNDKIEEEWHICSLNFKEKLANHIIFIKKFDANKIDDYNSFVKNFIKDIYELIFNDDSVDLIRINNEWKFKMTYDSLKKYPEYLFGDISFLNLILFVDTLPDSTIKQTVSVIDDMQKTFRKKIVVSLVINKVNDLFIKSYNKNLCMLPRDTNLRISDITCKLMDLKLIYDCLIDHFETLKKGQISNEDNDDCENQNSNSSYNPNSEAKILISENIKRNIDNINDDQTKKNMFVNTSSNYIDRTILNKNSADDCLEVILNSPLNDMEKMVYKDMIHEAESLRQYQKHIILPMDEDIKNYDDALNFEFLTSKSNQSFTLNNIASLSTSTWLNDEVLNCLIFLIQPLIKNKESYILFDSFLAEKMINSRPLNYHHHLKREIKKYYTKLLTSNNGDSNIKIVQNFELKSYLHKLEIIVFIRNIDKNHRQTIGIDFRFKIVYICDGFSDSCESLNNFQVFTLIADFLYIFGIEEDLNGLFDIIAEWKIERITKIQQVDNCSCGLISLIFSILLIFRINLNTLSVTKIKNDMMTTMRTKLASSIFCQNIFFSEEYISQIDQPNEELCRLYRDHIKPNIETLLNIKAKNEEALKKTPNKIKQSSKRKHKKFISESSVEEEELSNNHDFDNTENVENDHFDDDADKKDPIVLSEISKMELREGFKTISNHFINMKSALRERLNGMQTCVINAGFNYTTAVKSVELYLIWLETQTFKSFEHYIIEMNSNKRTKDSSASIETYILQFCDKDFINDTLKEEIKTIISIADNPDDPYILVSLINNLAKANKSFLDMYAANGNDKETMTSILKSLVDPRVFINRKYRVLTSLKRKYKELLATIFFISDKQPIKKQKKEGKKKEKKKKRAKITDDGSEKEKEKMNEKQNNEKSENRINDLSEENDSMNSKNILPNNSVSLKMDVNAAQTGVEKEDESMTTKETLLMKIKDLEEENSRLRDENQLLKERLATFNINQSS